MEKVLVAILLVLVRSGFPQDCPFNCRCTKYKIFCRGTTMRSLPEGRPTTTLLSMKNDVVPFLNQSVVSKPGLANLTTLELIQLNIKIIEARTFASTRALQSLTISKNTLTDLKPGAFEGLVQLTNLDLSENQMTSITSGVFKGLAALKYLNLASNAIGEVHSGIFDGLSGHKSALKVIDLSVNVISNMDGAAFNGLPSLKSLKLMFKNVSSSLVFDSMFSLNRLDMDGYRVALIPSNISTHALYNLRHLHVKNCNFPTLHDRFLEDSKLLTKLYILNSFVKNLDFNCFQGLNSLSELYLHDNQISILTEGVFKNLTTLKILDLSKNYLSGIGETFFLGLDRLVHLNVTKNFLYSIEKNAFSSLHSLKELVLYTDNTEITESFEDLYVTYAHGVHVVYSVDPGAFAGLFSLKSLQVPFNSRPSTVNVTLQSLGRLDTFLGPENFAPHNFQVINTLGFKISKKVNSSQVKNWFRQVPHIKQQVTLEIYDLESFAELSTFSDFNVSNLVVSSCQDGYIANNSFEGLSQLRSLLIRSLQQVILERGAFRNVRNLQHIQIYSVLIAPGVFQELGMLEKLIVGHEYIVSRTIVLTTDYLNGLKHIKVMILRNQNIQGIGSGIKLENLEKFDLSYNIISSLNESVFLGMPKIQTIDLSYNNISTLEVGAFLGLRDIKTINMMHNKRIESIGAGIFGAICDDNFTLTCANLTRLSVYCNSSFALETLTTLDLQFDSIEFIHPHAFLGCNNLKKLTLTGNKIQTLDFLYTPQLRYFYFSYNVNESLIKNNSFSCTSQLADIHFDKTKAKFMSANVFKPLNHLEHLHFPDAEVDCVLHENWQWIRSRNVPYSIPPKMEISLLNLECKDRADFIVQPKQHSSTGDEYIYFKMYIEPIVFIFIFLSGCFGNGLLLFVVFRHSDMRNKNNACVAHLAIADILSLLLNIPLSYFDVLHVSWNLGETACKIFITSKELVVALVAFSVVALTFERYLVVGSFNKLKSSHGSSVRPILLLSVVWVYALVFSIPSYSHATVEGRCLSSYPGSNGYVQRLWTFQLLISCLLPVVAIVFLNIMSAYTLKKSIRESPGEIRNQSRDERRNTVANMVTVLSLVFTLSSLPNFLLRTLVSWSVWTFEDVFWSSFVTFCLFYFHTIFNPFALFIMGSKYKAHIEQYIRIFVKEKQQVPSSQPDVRKELLIICDVMQKLGRRLAEDDLSQVSNHPDVEASRDEAAKRARLERIKRLQARFI